MAITRFIDIVMRSKPAEKSVKRLDKGMVKLGKDTDKTTKSFGALSKVATAVGTAISAIQIGRFSDSVAKADNQLRNITTSTEQFNEAQAELNRIANETRQDVNQLTDTYSKFARASTELGLTQREVLEFTESLTKAIKIEGNTVAEVNSVMLQLTQSFRSGRIAGEEFRAISEGSGLALKALALQMGVNVGELKKLASQGLITPETLIKGLAKLKPELDKQFIALQPTFADAGVRLSNALSEAFRASSLGSFFSTLNKGIIGGIDAISERVTDSGKLIVKQYELIGILGTDAVAVIKSSSIELASLKIQIQKSTDAKEILELQQKIKDVKAEIDATEGTISFVDKHFGDVTGLKREYAQLIIKIEEAKAAVADTGSTLDIEIKSGSPATDETSKPDSSKLQSIKDSFKTENQLLFEKFQADKLILDQEVIDKQERFDLSLALALQFSENLTAIEKEGIDERAQLEIDGNNRILAAKQASQNAALGLLSVFAAKSKTAAIVLLAIQKGLAISTTLTGALAGSVKVFGELPYPAAVVASGQILAQGKLTAGLIAATGLAQGAAISGGGGNVSSSAPIGGSASFNQGFQQAQVTPTSRRVIELRTDGSPLQLAIAEGVRDVLLDEDIVIDITNAQTELVRTGTI